MKIKRGIRATSILGLSLVASTVLADSSSLQVGEAQQMVQASAPVKHKTVNKKSIQNSHPQGWLNKQLGLGAQSRIHVNGFLSAGFSRSSSEQGYSIPGYGVIKNKFNFMANTLGGLQVIFNITKKLAAVVQVIANGDNSNGGHAFNMKLDWAYLRYQFSSDWQILAGRFRLPMFMYSSTQEVGYSYVWLYLPSEVYRIVPFYNVNGVETIYKMPLGKSSWTLQVQPFYGENNSQYDLYTNSIYLSGETADFDEDDIVGSVISLANQYVTFRAAYARTTLSGTVTTSSIPLLGPQKISVLHNAGAQVYTAGVKVDYHNFLASAEYAHRDTPKQLPSLTGYYGMLGYRIGKFIPNLTYAHISTTNTKELEAQDVYELPEAQQSYTGGLAYYVNNNLVLKGSISYINPLDGTNGLFNNNPGKHVWLYGVGLDAVF